MGYGGTYKGVHLGESCTSNYASLWRALSFIGGLGLAAPGGAREPVPMLSKAVHRWPTGAPGLRQGLGGELSGFGSKLWVTISFDIMDYFAHLKLTHHENYRSIGAEEI